MEIKRNQKGTQHENPIMNRIKNVRLSLQRVQTFRHLLDQRSAQCVSLFRAIQMDQGDSYSISFNHLEHDA